jgi:hypothetical protein
MIAALACLLLAIPTRVHEGDAQAFTSLTDAQGRPLADARYSQWIEGSLLHIETRADFPDGRIIVEHATMRLHPQLEQESWEWSEKNGDRLVRMYQVDFKTGKAVATRADQGKSWKEDLGIEPGKTFAGIGFIAVVKALRAQLAVGQHLELRAVGMTPKPRVATVTVTRDGPSPVRMAGRTIEGDRYTIHPEIPAIARLFVKAPDLHVWLVNSDPAAFLRFEGPLVEPGDPVIRIDLIPGPSAHAQPRSGPAPPRKK